MGFVNLPTRGTRYFLRRTDQSAIETLGSLLGDEAAQLLVMIQNPEQHDADSGDRMELLMELQDLVTNYEAETGF
jgi:hypothetical protein